MKELVELLKNEAVELLKNEAEMLKYADPIDTTQWAYNEGIEDLIITIENKLQKSNITSK